MHGSGGQFPSARRRNKFVMATLLIFFYLLVAAHAIGVHNNYDVVKKYNCWNKGELFLDRGILFSYDDAFLNSWPGNRRFDCQMPITARTKTTGIISVIQEMQFRKKADDCLDQVWFSNDDRKRCGSMALGLMLYSNGSIWNPPKFVSEFAGPFLPNVNWPESKQLVSPGASVTSSMAVSVYFQVNERAFQPGERLSFSIAFVGFKECDAFDIPKGMFNCGYGVCILDIFVGDGVVNCPFGDCRDEGSCEEVMSSMTDEINDSKNGTDVEDSMLSSKPSPMERYFRWLQERRRSIASEETEDKITKEVTIIAEEFKKHNGILEKISQFLGAGRPSIAT